MIDYYEQLTQEEKEEVTEVIQTLYRQTFLLERKFDKRAGRIFSAVLLSFFPMEIATRGAPPAPASMANALISIKMGVNKPTPVRAEAPTPGKQGTAREDFNNSRNYV